MKTNEMKAVLADEHPWFAELWSASLSRPGQLSRHLDGAIVDGIYVRVTELCGKPGDVVLMNQRVLHVTAQNALTTPRFMLSDFIA